MLLLCLCYPGEYLRLGTLISCNLAHVLEACDCLKLLSIYFNLRVDAAGVVCHQLGLLSTDLHALRFMALISMLYVFNIPQCIKKNIYLNISKPQAFVET